jgi:hypothetical protein
LEHPLEPESIDPERKHQTKEERPVTWTTWIETVPVDTTDEPVQGLYRNTRGMTTGRPPDSVLLTSLTPRVSGLLFDLQKAIHQEATGITLRESEIAALIVAVYNGCVH